MNAFEDHEIILVESSDSSSSESEAESGEQDQHKPTLSPAMVSKIMKSATKSNYNISTGADELVYDCAMKFAEVLFEEAKQQYHKAGSDKLTGDHFLRAFKNVGLFDYYGYFEAFLQILRENMNKIENSPTDEPQRPICSAEMVQLNNHLDQHHFALFDPITRRHLPLPVPAPFLVPPIPAQLLVPPIQIQKQHAPLILLGAHLPVHPHMHNLLPLFHMNNPISLLLPEPAHLLPQPAMPLQNAIAAAPLPFHPFANNLPWALPPLDLPHPLQHMMHAQTMSVPIQGGLAVHSLTVHHANPILREQEQIHNQNMHGGDDEATSGVSETNSCEMPPFKRACLG